VGVGHACCGGQDGEEVRFTSITFFVGMDAVRGFAGDTADVAVVEDEARKALSRWDSHVVHHEVAVVRQVAAKAWSVADQAAPNHAGHLAQFGQHYREVSGSEGRLRAVDRAADLCEQLVPNRDTPPPITTIPG